MNNQLELPFLFVNTCPTCGRTNNLTCSNSYHLERESHEDDSIPESFYESLNDFEEGRVVSLQTALFEEYKD